MRKEQIKGALAYSGMSQRKIASELDTTQANLNTKINRETLTDQELEQIAKSIGAKYKCYFEFEDGTKI